MFAAKTDLSIMHTFIMRHQTNKYQLISQLTQVLFIAGSESCYTASKIISEEPSVETCLKKEMKIGRSRGGSESELQRTLQFFNGRVWRNNNPCEISSESSNIHFFLFLLHCLMNPWRVTRVLLREVLRFILLGEFGGELVSALTSLFLSRVHFN